MNRNCPKISLKKRFTASLHKRYFLRIHMFVILLTATLAGVLATKVMLTFGLQNVSVRYPITVLFAYLVFFGAIKFWLFLMTGSSSNTGSKILDGTDLPLSSGGGSEIADFVGGGGNAGGAGASADFGDALQNTDDATSGVGDALGDAVGGVTDDEGGLALVVVLGLLALLLVSVLGTGVFLIWEAPAILSEAAFNTVLAASLMRSTKHINTPDWEGSVFRATWKPFAIVLVFALLAGCAMHRYIPQASSLMDVIHMFG